MALDSSFVSPPPGSPESPKQPLHRWGPRPRGPRLGPGPRGAPNQAPPHPRQLCRASGITCVSAPRRPWNSRPAPCLQPGGLVHPQASFTAGAAGTGRAAVRRVGHGRKLAGKLLGEGAAVAVVQSVRPCHPCSACAARRGPRHWGTGLAQQVQGCQSVEEGKESVWPCCAGPPVAPWPCLPGPGAGRWSQPGLGRAPCWGAPRSLVCAIQAPWRTPRARMRHSAAGATCQLQGCGSCTGRTAQAWASCLPAAGVHVC